MKAGEILCKTAKYLVLYREIMLYCFRTYCQVNCNNDIWRNYLPTN